MQRKVRKSLYGEKRKNRKAERETDVPEREKSLGIIWKMALSPFCFWGRIGNVVNAAAEGLQKRTEMMDSWQQQEVQVQRD